MGIRTINELQLAMGETDARFDSQATVVFQDTATGLIYNIDELTFEKAEQDEDGNVLSTGATLFIRGSEA